MIYKIQLSLWKGSDIKQDKGDGVAELSIAEISKAEINKAKIIVAKISKAKIIAVEISKVFACKRL